MHLSDVYMLHDVSVGIIELDVALMELVDEVLLVIPCTCLSRNMAYIRCDEGIVGVGGGWSVLEFVD